MGKVSKEFVAIFALCSLLYQEMYDINLSHFDDINFGGSVKVVSHIFSVKVIFLP